MVFQNVALDSHEKIVFCNDDKTGLRAIIAIHSTALGPAAGGCRLWSYQSEEEALFDVLKLSKAMSYKNAMAGLDFGGGKAVIIKTEDFSNADEIYEKFGEFVDQFNGSYITAEDVGMTMRIMQLIARNTRHVTGLPKEGSDAGGDPSPKTSWGILKGIEAAVRFKLGKSELDGLTIAVQGVGNVGYHLCKYLSKVGVKILVADIDVNRVKRVIKEFNVTAIDYEDILYQKVDVLSPCALGSILNKQSIPRLKTEIIAGGANNQLESDQDGRRLFERGILYAPDYVINGGGIINVAAEYYGNADDDQVIKKVSAIGPRLNNIFKEAERLKEPTNEIADAQAESIISIGKS